MQLVHEGRHSAQLLALWPTVPHGRQDVHRAMHATAALLWHSEVGAALVGPAVVGAFVGIIEMHLGCRPL